MNYLQIIFGNRLNFKHGGKIDFYPRRQSNNGAEQKNLKSFKLPIWLSNHSAAFSSITGAAQQALCNRKAHDIKLVGVSSSHLEQKSISQIHHSHLLNFYSYHFQSRHKSISLILHLWGARYSHE